MLLRSASHPILNSWFPRTKDPSPEPEMSPQIQRTRSGNHLLSLSMSLSPSNSFSTSPADEHMGRESSERRRSPPTPISRGLSSVSVEEEREAEDPDFESEPSSALSPILLSSGLEGLITAVNECCVLGEKKSKGCATLVFGGGCGSGGGKVCGGGRSDGDGGFGPLDSDNGNESVDAYYQKMIKADPGNALILGNYSKFLKEVRCNLEKAEHYCGLAILANPTDASVLALYADLIWQIHGDAPRAESYFERAIQAAPDDCYVMGSYARFLWDAETVEEKEEENEFDKEYSCSSNSSPPFFHGTSFPSPIAATS